MSAPKKTAKVPNAGKGVTIPAAQFAQFANIKAISKELVQMEEEREASEAKREAEMEAIMDRRDHPLKHLADDDILKVSERIGDVLQSLLSIHQIAGDVFEADTETAARYGLAIKEMARANIKGLDACMERLTGGPAFGNFATEFDRA
jgi:hypothetical protein